MPTIYQSLFVAATAEKVYDAIVSLEGLSAWWSPDVTQAAAPDSGFRVSFGPTYRKEFIVEELTPVSIRWRCIAGADEWIGSSVRFDLESGGAESLLRAHPEMADQIRQQSEFEHGTLLSLTHTDWREYTPMFAECSYTWSRFLRSLKLLCETGCGRPWPAQHIAQTQPA